MATATLKEKAKKVIENITGTEQEEVLYFKDAFALEQWGREIIPILQSGCIALRAFNRFYKVENISEFFGMLKDPFAFYQYKHRIAHEADFDKYDALGVELKISEPKGFDEVRSVVTRANRYFEKANHKYFEIDADDVVLTSDYYNRRNTSCYLIAKGPEEIERLNYCLGVIEALEKLEPILLRNKKLAEAVKTKKYALPLNYFLKIVNTKEGAKLIPNASFVREGFAGSAHLGIYIPTKAERKMAQRDAMPKLGPKYVKITRHFHDGHTEDFLIPQSELEKYYHDSDKIHDGYRNEFDEPWGTPLNSQHARPSKVTFYNPMMIKPK